MADNKVELREEVWKAIPGILGYEASSFGRIRSVDRVAFPWKSQPDKPRRHRGRVLKLAAVNPHGGHLQVNLANKTYRVPGLIMRAFVGPCPEGLEVCHEVADTNNNRLDNLRYDTRLSNRADMRRA
jgi:hypothetical protein